MNDLCERIFDGHIRNTLAFFLFFCSFIGEKSLTGLGGRVIIIILNEYLV